MKPARTVLALAAMLFLANIWGYDLWNPNEPFFGEGAREMLVDGQWLVTHINGELNTHKPPLFFWLIALFSLPFGEVSAMTSRLPSVLAALGTLALTLSMARRIGSERTAVLAVAVLASSLMFWEQARWAEIDSLLCCLVWAALSAFEAWEGGRLDGRRAGLIFWAASALAVLAKGPVGLLLPLGGVAVSLATSRSLNRFRRFAPLSGPILFVAIAGAWAGAAEVWGPAEYSVLGALKEHFVDRGIHGMHHAQPWWYFAAQLPAQFMPWSVLLPGAALLAWRRRDRTDRFLLATVIFIVVFFSISTEKRAVYVLPAFPALALLTARFVAAVLGWEEAPRISRRWFTIGQTVLAGLLILVGGAVPFAAGRVEGLLPVWHLWTIGAVLVATGAVTIVHLLRRRFARAVWTPAAGFATIFLLAAVLVFPAANHFKSGRPLGLAIKQEAAASYSAGNPVLAYRVGTIHRSFAFYSDGVYLTQVENVGVLARHLDRQPRVFAVVSRDGLDELPLHLRERIVTLATMKGDRHDLALIANR